MQSVLIGAMLLLCVYAGQIRADETVHLEPNDIDIQEDIVLPQSLPEYLGLTKDGVVFARPRQFRAGVFNNEPTLIEPMDQETADRLDREADEGA